MDLNVCTQCHVLHVCPSRDLKARSYRRTFCLNYQGFFSLNFLFFHIFLFFFAPILECEAFQIFCPLLKRGKFGKKLLDFLSKLPGGFFVQFFVFPYFPLFFCPNIGMRSLPNILPSVKKRKIWKKVAR